MEQFTQQHAPELSEAMAQDGPAGVIDLINGYQNPIDRLNLYFLAQRTFGQQNWPGANLDDYIKVAEAGMAEALSQASVAEDGETAAKRIDNANVMSYNLAADLAPCWPGDDLDRGPQHFRRGVQAADDCLHWRNLLGKDSYSFCIAHWVRGIHKLALGELAEAQQSLMRSVQFAVKFAAEEGKPQDVRTGGSYFVILGSGYLGLAMWLDGDEAGKDIYLDAIAAFKGTLAESDATKEQRTDARFGIDQLIWMRSKYTP